MTKSIDKHLRKTDTENDFIMKPYASFGLRFVAFFIDLLITLLILAALYSMLGLSQQNDMKIIIFNVIEIVWLFFNFICYPSKTGQTLGKKLIKIKVINSQGKTPSLLTFLLRETIGRMISGSFLGLGLFWMLWDSKSQTWHDKIAGTFVVEN